MSAPYPYTFALNEPAICLLIAKMSIWCYRRSMLLQNVVEVFVDSTKVAVVRENNNTDFRLEARVGDLEAGQHQISFTSHYETHSGEVHDPPHPGNSAQNYFTISWVKVIAKPAE